MLDKRAAHALQETRAHPATKPNRFQLLFPTIPGSWRTLIEMFSTKLSKQSLRGIRMGTVDEPEARTLRYLDWVNEDPVPFHWRYKRGTLVMMNEAGPQFAKRG